MIPNILLQLANSFYLRCMKITLFCVGKTTKDYFIKAEMEYENRLQHYINFERFDFPELKNTKGKSTEQIKQEEGELILKKIATSDHLILLDEAGKHYTSIDFSHELQKYLNMGLKNLVFVVGGAYGFSDDVYQRANGKMSLSKMTFSHQMVRTFFLEQLYRGFTILRNEPYHHQ